MRKYSNIVVLTDDEEKSKQSNALHKRLDEGLDFLSKAQTTNPESVEFIALANETADVVRDLTIALIGIEPDLSHPMQGGQNAVEPRDPSSPYRAKHLRCPCGAALPPKPGRFRCHNCGASCNIVEAKSIGTTDDLVVTEVVPSTPNK